MKFPERSEKSSKNILKLKAEESVVGVFRGDIYSFRQHWENQKPFPCGANCARCAAGNKSSFRFQLNFITKENAVLVAKVFEQGWQVYEQLEELNKDYPLENNWLKITRKGNGTDTSYTILPIKDCQLTRSQQTEVAKIALHVLDPSALRGSAQALSATDGPMENEDAEVAFP